MENRGITLVELIIAIAMSSIIIGATTLLIRTAQKARLNTHFSQKTGKMGRKMLNGGVGPAFALRTECLRRFYPSRRGKRTSSYDENV